MKTQILIRFNLEGLHAWPGVVDNDNLAKKVGFLQFPHRHQFFFELKKSVSHADRDIEIIDLKRVAMHYLYEKYGHSPTETTIDYKSHCNFGSQSCEMIAEELVKKFDLDSCQVLEDNENGAIATKTDLEMKQNVPLEIDNSHRNDRGESVVFICGKLCSGKSTLSKAILALYTAQIDKPKAISIEVSDIVKSVLAEAKNRQDLQGHPELDQQIIRTLDNAINSADGPVIVSGARQSSILNAFPKATVIWIDTPEQVRFQRFEKSAKDHDQSFAGFTKANERDDQLGLKDIKQTIFTRNKY